MTSLILPRTYVCKVTGCEHQEPNRKAFETHVKTVHPNECWLCDLCGRNFSGEFDGWIDNRWTDGQTHKLCGRNFSGELIGQTDRRERE